MLDIDYDKKIDKALEVLFAESIEDIDGLEETASILGASLNHTDHWRELRYEARVILGAALKARLT